MRTCKHHGAEVGTDNYVCENSALSTFHRCEGDAGPETPCFSPISRALDARTRAVLASRYLAGESVPELAEDYALSPLATEHAIRDGLAERVREAEEEIATLRGLLRECAGWINDTCGAVGMSYTRLNAGRTLLCRLAAALEGEG